MSFRQRLIIDCRLIEEIKGFYNIQSSLLMERDENRTEAKTSSDTRPGSLLDPIRMRRKVRLKIFRMKTFGSKPLQREPKRGSDNFARAQVLEVSSACRASIKNEFESFKFPNRGAGDLADVA